MRSGSPCPSDASRECLIPQQTLEKGVAVMAVSGGIRADFEQGPLFTTFLVEEMVS